MAVIVLAFCTSATVCSVAALRGSDVLANASFEHEMRLLERLIPVTHDVLKNAGIALADVDLIGADVGPGSFTGIRIGVMTAKTLAWALQKDAVGVSSLECLAHMSEMTPVVALVRARPGMVYRQAFGPDRSPLDEAQIVSAEAGPDILGAAQYVSEPVIVADFEVATAPIEHALRGLGDPLVMRARIDAETVGRLAQAKARSATDGALHLQPAYVAEPLIGPPKKT